LIEVVDEAVESEAEPLVSNLKFDIKESCAITDKSDFNITSVRKIYDTQSETEEVETVACDSVTVAVEESENYYQPSSQQETSISWPSDVIAAYEVYVKSGDNQIVFTVVQLDENNFRIFSTKGLYSFDLSDVTKKTGCSVSLTEDVDDDQMKDNVSTAIDILKTFDIFSNAIAGNDSAKIIRLFPALVRHEYQFKGKPLPREYKQIGNGAVITTGDSVAFKFSADGVIVDSYGVISSKSAEDAVKALDGAPRSRGERFDIEYIDALGDQATSLQREKERKARAARYKAQGVALISSNFSSDGNGAKGVEFSALNTSSKPAKYIIMEVVGYNSVDDPVWSNGYLKRCRGIGPIAPGEGGSWNFNDIWENGSIVADYQIKTLIIQYTDGTSKSVKLPQSLPSDWRDWLY